MRPGMTSLRQYLIWFANEHVEFKLPELDALISLYNINLRWVERYNQEPYAIVEMPSESAAKLLASRSILTRSIFELWGRAKSTKELHYKLQNLPSEFLRPYCNPDASFKICVETFCKSISLKTKIDKIEELSFLPLEGPVQLKNPKHTFYLIEHYGTDPNNIPDEPADSFFGRWITDGRRDAINQLTLKKRIFIGNTSMDAQLSLIMANQAKVYPGSMVLDPFVGTGSLLVAAAFFGGYVMGTDIDFLIIHGRGKASRCNQKKRNPGESLKANLRQYGLEHRYIDVLVADSSLPLWRTTQPLFDAIITDPPYGIREATEKIGSHKNIKIKEEYIASHIPSKVHYSLGHLLKDLLDLSVNLLTLGGRLVYWLPTCRDDYSDASLPTHPCLKFISNCEQTLTKHSSRRLVTMEKISEPNNKIGQCNVSDAIGSFRARYFNSSE